MSNQETESQVAETTEPQVEAPKAEQAQEKPLSDAQAKKAQQAERTKARSKDLNRLAKLADQITKAEELRTERNQLIAELVADGVERNAIQEKSGLTVPRFRQVVAAQKSS